MTKRQIPDSDRYERMLKLFPSLISRSYLSEATKNSIPTFVVYGQGSAGKSSFLNKMLERVSGFTNFNIFPTKSTQCTKRPICVTLIPKPPSEQYCSIQLIIKTDNG